MNKTEASIELWKKLNFIYHIMLGMLCAMAIFTGICVRIYPMTPAIKLLLLCTVLFGVTAILLAIMGTCHNRPKLLYPLLFLAALIFVWLFLGRKEPDTNGLRKIYITRLEAHENVRYMTGGETDRGVDSHGLAKSSFWQAMVIEGLRELNPRLLGKLALDFWFTTLSNTDLIYGRLGYTRVVDHPKTLVGYDSFLLDSGDMAITRNADHLMVYLSEGEWIISEKQSGKVKIIRTVSGKSLPDEFSEPVIIVRWWLLDTESSTINNNK